MEMPSDRKRDEEEEYSNWSDVLTDDLRVEILCRLPEKPLFRFKCVSKSWHSLISNTCVPRITPPSMSAPLSGFLFRSAELSCNGSDDVDAVIDYAPYGPPSCSYSRSGDSDSDSGSEGDRFVKSYSALLPVENTDVQDCCNGLLLIMALKSSSAAVVPVEYYVCNPVTEQCIPIPINPSHLKPMFAALAFDPSESPNYKVVRFNRLAASASIDHPPTLDVISSETGVWVTHTVQLEPELYGFHWVMRSVYLNGVLYMLSLAKYLLCFDLNNKSIAARSIELPPEEEKEDTKTDNLGFIGISRGRLYYSNRDPSNNTIFIWSLRCRCGDWHWVLNHTISIDDLVLHHPLGRILDRYRVSPFFKPYAIHPTSQVIFLGIPDMILSYDVKTRRLEKVFAPKFRTMILVGQYGVFPYSRCPVPLKDCLVLHNIDTEQFLALVLLQVTIEVTVKEPALL